MLVCVAAAALTLCAGSLPAAAQPGDVHLIANASFGTALSPDGSHVAFSASGNVLVEDVATGTVASISTPLPSVSPSISISNGGARVAYKDQTDDLVIVDVGNGTVHQTGVRVFNAEISGDGSTVLFTTQEQLAAVDQDQGTDLYVDDVDTGAVTYVGIDIEPQDAGVFGMDISDDGTVVAAETYGNSGKGPGPQKDIGVFVKDLATDNLTLLATPDDGPTSFSYEPSVSGDGTHVAVSSAGQGASGVVRVIDLGTGDMVVASTDDDGNAVLGRLPSLNNDGSRVAFATPAQLDAADTDMDDDVYVKDLATGDVQLATRSAGGAKANGVIAEGNPLSDDGTKVMFLSTATNLGATDGSYHAYVKELRPFGLSNPDSDGDGIDDILEPSGTPAGSFVDSSTSPATTGSITSADPGVTVRVVDAPSPAGVEITVTGPSGGATLALCDQGSVRVDVGTDVVETCHSLVLRVVTGRAVVNLSPTTTLTVPTGASAEVVTNANGTFTVQNVSGASVTLNSGGTTTTIAPGQTDANLDATPPMITPTVTGTLGTNGWYSGNVGVSWVVTDGQSQVTSKNGCTSSTVTSDTTGTAKTCSATSRGGTASVSVTIKRDATAPSVGFGSHPSSYTVDQAVAISCSASDRTSGIATGCTPVNGPAYAFNVGSNTVSTSATDNAGNTKTVSTSFTVTVTATSLCNLTRQFVHASARYQSSSTSQRNAVDAAIGIACATLKPHQTTLYKSAVSVLVGGSWLTSSQGVTLRNLADKL
jgi:hypothetical protein